MIWIGSSIVWLRQSFDFSGAAQLLVQMPIAAWHLADIGRRCCQTRCTVIGRITTRILSTEDTYIYNVARFTRIKAFVAMWRMRMCDVLWDIYVSWVIRMQLQALRLSCARNLATLTTVLHTSNNNSACSKKLQNSQQAFYAISI